MVEMKREDFISQMIAELARQKAADESAFANPPIRNSMEIFRSLCFDFPTVYSDEISALANAINKIALEKADIDSVGGFSLEEKFLQNLIYLSGSTPDVVDNNRESAVSSLCRAVFINLPLRLLTLSRKQLSTIFRDQPSTAIPNQNDFSVAGKEVDLLPWVEICHRVRNFVMLGTSSLLACSPTSATSVDSRIGDCLVSLSTAIKMVRCDKRNRDIVRVKMDDALTTLHQCFLFNDDLVLKAALDDRKAGDGPAAGAGAGAGPAVDGTAQSTAASSSESESSAICGMAKDIWIHLSFLCRDLFVQHPESLDHPTALPAVLGALIPLGSITSTGTGPSFSFPTAEECVFALILAGIVTGVVHTDAGDTARDAVSTGVTATMIEDNRVRLKQRAVRCSKARTTLRKHLDSFSPSLLVVAVAICERISNTSASNTNGDGAALLCDIATLYTAETEGTAKALSRAHPHEHLMSSRALSALVCMWVDIVSREGSTASEKDRTLSAAPSADVDADAVAIAPHRALGPTASRIMQTLAVLCLQRPLTATYVLKIPRLVISVVKATKQWQSGTSGTEDTRYVLPGEAIGLLIALLLVAETQPKSPADSTAESLSESLTGALTQLKAEVCSAFAAVGKRKDGQRSTLPFDVYGTKEELNQKKRHTTFLAPKGLLQSLRLITSESGGASSLRSSVTMKGGGGGGRTSAVRALQVWAADILSPPTAPLVLPETYQEEIGKEVLEEEEIIKEEIAKEVKREEVIVKEEIGKEGKEEEEEKTAKQEEDEDEDEKIVKQEEKDEEGDDGGGDVEELRRLVKALQALLQGFSTSKID